MAIVAAALKHRYPEASPVSSLRPRLAVSDQHQHLHTRSQVGQHEQAMGRPLSLTLCTGTRAEASARGEAAASLLDAAKNAGA